jgi:hypothetical protein
VTSLVRPREGRPRLPTQHEGVPPHLRAQLITWLRETFRVSRTHGGNLGLLRQVATYLQLDVNPTNPGLLWRAIDGWYAEEGDQERLLDVVNIVIQLTGEWQEVAAYLELGESVHVATPQGIQRKVDPTSRAAIEAATQPEDEASDHLVEAWSNAYGRPSDASDAWDHAIKALEVVLIKTVVPKQDKPTLGHVVQHLRTQGHLWKLGLPGPNDDYSVEPLVAMLDLIWPNPDRHGNPQHRRRPAIDEARAVVQLAVAIVQWGRDGQIVRK